MRVNSTNSATLPTKNPPQSKWSSFKRLPKFIRILLWIFIFIPFTLYFSYQLLQFSVDQFQEWYYPLPDPDGFSLVGHEAVFEYFDSTSNTNALFLYSYCNFSECKNNAGVKKITNKIGAEVKLLSALENGQKPIFDPQKFGLDGNVKKNDSLIEKMYTHSLDQHNYYCSRHGLISFKFDFNCKEHIEFTFHSLVLGNIFTFGSFILWNTEPLSRDGIVIYSSTNNMVGFQFRKQEYAGVDIYRHVYIYDMNKNKFARLVNIADGIHNIDIDLLYFK